MHNNTYITLYVSPTDAEKCSSERNKMLFACATSGTIPTKDSRIERINEKNFYCSKNFFNISSPSFTSMYLYCIVKKGEYDSEVIKFKYIDCFRVLTGVPHWVIWAVIALQCLFIVCSCLWCCCITKS